MLKVMAFCHLQETLVISMGKINGYCNKNWNGCCKNSLHHKRVVQKTAEATGDLIGNKMADKITSIGKPKAKEKEKEIEEIYIPIEKRQ